MGKIFVGTGHMEEKDLERRDILVDDAVERTTVVEYWKDGTLGCEHAFDPRGLPEADTNWRPCLKCDAKLVHRSVDMKLKKAATFAEGAAAKLK